MMRPKRVAFRTRNGVGTRGLAFAAQWLAYALPYRRFVAVLADTNARLGADVDRYSFIVVDLHHLLLAGLPAHFESYMLSQAVRRKRIFVIHQPTCVSAITLSCGPPNKIAPNKGKRPSDLRTQPLSQAPLQPHAGRRSCLKNGPTSGPVSISLSTCFS
jgi:hypothetical protein